MLTDLRIAVVNWEDGGIDRSDLSQPRWAQTIAVLRDWDPHVVMCQEFTGMFPWALHQQVWKTANALGMFPCVGPPGAQTAAGLRPGILVSLRAGLTVLDQGPPPTPLSAPWCDVTLEVPGMAGPLHLYSVHMPPFSGTLQIQYTEWLTARIAQHGQPSVIAGDWNSYSGEGMDQPADLTTLPPHLIPTRLTVRDGRRELNTGLHQLLTDMGFHDVAVLVPAEDRTPARLMPTGCTGVEREFRGYVTGHLKDLVSAYAQAPVGSDHHAIMTTLTL